MGVFVSFKIIDKTLFTLSSLALYFVVLFIPYSLFHFPIYNDQLGFAIETLYGMRVGVVMPYQGDYTTLGHAFFTASVGEILGLNLFQATRFVEAVFMLTCFIVYFSLAMSILKKNNTRNKNFLAVLIIMFFPAFIVDPLVYSRGYFGLIVSMTLFLSMFKFMEKNDTKSSIIATITFIASSISYALQPLIVVIAMALFTLFSRFLISSGKNEYKLHRTLLKTLLFFTIWSAIQVYLGYNSWVILHEIVQKILTQEFFTGFEYPALQYIGEAVVYTYLRTSMMAVGWLIAIFIVLTFILKFLKNKDVAGVKLFAFSLIASSCFLGILYGITYHEPALRFYRVLVATMPFALTYMVDKITVRSSFRKKIPALLLAITIIFLILSPVTKWGWTFVGYPTEHDISLSNFIVQHPITLTSDFYAPGSHQLLEFLFKTKTMLIEKSELKIMGGDVRFNSTEASLTTFTATFYRIFIYPRWFGENISATINDIHKFASMNNLLYNDNELWLLIQSK
jgi:hypothetical protein